MLSLLHALCNQRGSNSRSLTLVFLRREKKKKKGAPHLYRPPTCTTGPYATGVTTVDNHPCLHGWYNRPKPPEPPCHRHHDNPPSRPRQQIQTPLQEKTFGPLPQLSDPIQWPLPPPGRQPAVMAATPIPSYSASNHIPLFTPLNKNVGRCLR